MLVTEGGLEPKAVQTRPEACGGDCALTPDFRAPRVCSALSQEE